MRCCCRGAADRRRLGDDSNFDSSAALQMLVQQARQEAGKEITVSAAHDFRQVCLRGFLLHLPLRLLAVCFVCALNTQSDCEYLIFTRLWLQVDVPQQHVMDINELRRERRPLWQQLQHSSEVKQQHCRQSAQTGTPQQQKERSNSTQQQVVAC